MLRSYHRELRNSGYFNQCVISVKSLNRSYQLQPRLLSMSVSQLSKYWGTSPADRLRLENVAVCSSVLSGVSVLFAGIVDSPGSALTSPLPPHQHGLGSWGRFVIRKFSPLPSPLTSPSSQPGKHSPSVWAGTGSSWRRGGPVSLWLPGQRGWRSRSPLLSTTTRLLQGVSRVRLTSVCGITRWWRLSSSTLTTSISRWSSVLTASTLSSCWTVGGTPSSQYGDLVSVWDNNDLCEDTPCPWSTRQQSTGRQTPGQVRPGSPWTTSLRTSLCSTPTPSTEPGRRGSTRLCLRSPDLSLTSTGLTNSSRSTSQPSCLGTRGASCQLSGGFPLRRTN